MNPPETEKDRPARPAASDSIIVHIIDEMPRRVVFAVMFVVFFFTWGGVNNLVRFINRINRDAAAPNTTIGLYAGAFAALVVPIIIWRVKHRAK